MTQLSRINTHSQEWARKHGACFGGRRRLGKLSVWQYFKRTRVVGDMIWVALKLGPTLSLDPAVDNASTLVCYERAIYEARNRAFRAYGEGMRGIAHTRKNILEVMRNYQVRWPVEIL